MDRWSSIRRNRKQWYGFGKCKKNVFEGAGTEIQDTVIDRAHQIGKGYTVAKTKKKSQKGPQRSVTEQQYAGQEKA